MSIHPFELSGLGLAPFRLVAVASFAKHTGQGNVDAVNQKNREAIATLSSRGLSGGICMHCGMTIMHNFIVRSQDGKYAVVGSDCVAKTAVDGSGDRLKVAVARKLKEINRERYEAAAPKRAAKAAKVAADLEELLVKHADELSRKPHPNSYFALQGKTYLDYVRYLLNGCGDSGKARWLKFLRGMFPEAS